MKPPEAFGVVVRGVGLLLVVSALYPLFAGLMTLTPGALVVAIPILLLGLWLLRGAEAIVSFAYPTDGGTNRTGPENLER